MNNSRMYNILTISGGAILLLQLLMSSLPPPVTADCHLAGAATISFVLQIQKNATGHRNVKVKLQSRATPGNSKADLSGIEASQTVHLCDGLEVVDTFATISASPAQVRPLGYEVFPGLGYYKFHTKPVIWDEAYLTCVSEGSHLLVLNSEAESNVLRQFLGRKSTVEGPTWPNWAWAGFHDRGLEADYRTVLGDPLNETGYTKWHPGQPDNKPWGTEPDQDCGSFNHNALLNDLPCLGKLPFICEQSM